MVIRYVVWNDMVVQFAAELSGLPMKGNYGTQICCRK